MSISFILWAFYKFSGNAFAICGKTIRSIKRNFIDAVFPAIKNLGFKYSFKVSENFSNDLVRMLIEQMFYDASLHSGYTVTYKLMYDDIVTMHCIIHKDLKLYDVYITKGSLSKMLSERNDQIVDYISKNIEQLKFRKPSNDDETNLIYKKFNTSKREMTFE